MPRDILNILKLYVINYVNKCIISMHVNHGGLSNNERNTRGAWKMNEFIVAFSFKYKFKIRISPIRIFNCEMLRYVLICEIMFSCDNYIDCVYLFIK